jgi:hypothetical protein
MGALYIFEFSQIETLVPCPCSATQCCFTGIACIDK